MLTTVLTPLNIIASNTKGIGSENTNLVLFSDKYLEPHMMFYTPNYGFYQTVREDGHKGRTGVAVKKGFPHSCIDLPPLQSLEVTGVCIPIGNTEVFLSAVFKTTQRLCSDINITELLDFRNRSIPAGDLNARHPVWSSKDSYPSHMKLLELFVRSNFEISTPTMLYALHT
jgi:hypothetical protein